MKNIFKLGFGPMSIDIVKSISSYSLKRNYPLMIIASRNQIDVDSGYVMNTQDLQMAVSFYKNNNLLICRDHCGPYFLDSEKSLTERQAIEATKKTIAKDIEQGFDLIHIDTSRCSSGYVTAEELIKFCLDLNKNIFFEFGTEENIGVAAGIQKYKDDVAFAKQFKNMKIVVAQTGSLDVENRQGGSFDFDAVTELVDFANNAGVGLKEHNADYLTAEQIQLRKSAGVHAMNIAPQLGVIQTILIKKLCNDYNLLADWDEFSNEVLKSEKWKKWNIDSNSEGKVVMAGHYLFQHPSYFNLIKKLDHIVNWRKLLDDEIFNLIDLYKNNLEE